MLVEGCAGGDGRAATGPAGVEAPLPMCVTRTMGTVTAKNQLDSGKSPFGNGETIRASMAALAVAHTFDHYGQMVVYARMNGVVPPASR